MGLGDFLSQVQGALQSAVQDPLKRQVLLSVGGALMQPMPVGQTAAGQLGQAIAGGAQLYQQLLEQQRQAQMQQDLLGLRRRAQEFQEERFRQRQELARKQLGLEERKVRMMEDLTKSRKRLIDASTARTLAEKNVRDLEASVKALEAQLLAKYGEERTQAEIARLRAMVDAYRTQATSGKVPPAEILKLNMFKDAFKQRFPYLSDGDATLVAALFLGTIDGAANFFNNAPLALSEEQMSELTDGLFRVVNMVQEILQPPPAATAPTPSVGASAAPVQPQAGGPKPPGNPEMVGVPPLLQQDPFADLMP